MAKAPRRPRHVPRPHGASGDMSFDGHVETIMPVQCPRGPNCHVSTQRQLILFSNGVNTPLESERGTAQSLANKSGKAITMVHNGTNGLVRDMARLTRANLGSHVYPAAEQEAELLEDALEKKEPAVILCHSAGCAQVNESLSDLRVAMKGQVNPRTGKLYTEAEILALERSLEKRLDYGPANTHLEPGPYSRITVRSGDVATPLHLLHKLDKNQYDERKDLPALKKTLLEYIPLVGHGMHAVRAHNFDSSYTEQAVEDILTVSHGARPNELGIRSLESLY